MGRPVFHDLDLAALVERAAAIWVALVEAPDVMQSPAPLVTPYRVVEVVHRSAPGSSPVLVGAAHYATLCERNRQAALGRTFSYPAYRYPCPQAVLDLPPFTPRLVFVTHCREPGVPWELAAQGGMEDVARLQEVRALLSQNPA